MLCVDAIHSVMRTQSGSTVSVATFGHVREQQHQHQSRRVGAATTKLSDHVIKSELHSDRQSWTE